MFTKQWFGGEIKFSQGGRTAHLRWIKGANKSTFSVSEEGHIICEGSRPTLLACLRQAQHHFLAPVQQSLVS